LWLADKRLHSISSQLYILSLQSYLLVWKAILLINTSISSSKTHHFRMRKCGQNQQESETTSDVSIEITIVCRSSTWRNCPHCELTLLLHCPCVQRLSNQGPSDVRSLILSISIEGPFDIKARSYWKRVPLLLHGRNDQTEGPSKENQKNDVILHFLSNNNLSKWTPWLLQTRDQHVGIHSSPWKWISSFSSHLCLSFSSCTKKTASESLRKVFGPIMGTSNSNMLLLLAIGSARQLFIQMAIANHGDCCLNVSGLE
jgi:hypothetical protein